MFLLSNVSDLLLCYEEQVPNSYIRAALFDDLSGFLGGGNLIPKVSEYVALVGVVKVSGRSGPKFIRKAVLGVTKGGGFGLIE
tara:strand:- start:219 stop:467 length:249 start_codon:yes stop_codon:yes gene_type:complete